MAALKKGFGGKSNLFKKALETVEELYADGNLFIAEDDEAKGSINARRLHQLTQPKEDPEIARMNELDESGWGHIHHAAFRGFIKSIERFVKANEDQLEMETGDDLHSTPLHLSVMSGNLDTVKCIIGLGASITSINSQNHGVVELAAMKQFVPILEYFAEVNHPKLPVWKQLLKFLSSDADEEAENAGKCLQMLTKRNSEGVNPNWEHVYNNGGVPVIVKVIKGTIGDDARIQAFHVLNNILTEPVVKEQTASSGGIPATVNRLKSETNFVIQLSGRVLKEICKVKEYADQAVQSQAIQTIIKVLQTVKDNGALTECVEALGVICEANPVHQATLGSLHGAITSVVELFEDCTNKDLLMALTKAVGRIVRGNTANQTNIIDNGGASHIITLTGTKCRELQMNSVEAIHRLADNNAHTQQILIEEGAVMPLMQLLKRNRQQDMLEKTAAALWALAGDDEEERRSMASKIGVHLLIEFLSSLSDDLHFIGSEGIGVLGQGPYNKQNAIADAYGVHPLVRLLRSSHEHIVLSAIRSIRHLCVGPGFIPHQLNQMTVNQSRGIKFLVALMVHSQNEMIQVESALTLGCVALGHPDNLEEIRNNMDFSYVRILKMLYSRDDMVRLLAGSALAAFSFNNLKQQKEIAEQGGIRFNCFVPFLQSESEYFRCNAAFQVVVLGRIIPDEEQAISSAAGIKLLVDVLSESKSNSILALACDCIARLAHTRAGVPAAIVSISAVNILCDYMLSTSESVRGTAAVALGYLSYNHHAERQLLNRCRTDPYLMKVLKFYTDKNKISSSFVEEWKHYKKIGLPPIHEGKVSLVTRKNSEVVLPPIQDNKGRPLTLVSLGDSTSQSRSTPTNPLSGLNEEMFDRSSRMSRNSNPLQKSQLSLHSEGSRIEKQSNSIIAE